ncbi:MAG: hypothetical protein JXQ97_15660 [Natronospirillum sp.]
MAQKKHSLLKRILKTTLISSALASKATATVIAPFSWGFGDTDWSSLYAQGDTGSDNFELRQHLFELAKSATSRDELLLNMQISYETAPIASYPAVDAFWLEVIAERGEAELTEELLTIRSAAVNMNPVSRQTYLEEWLHKAHHAPGHYDCGGGNNGGPNGPNPSTPGCR